MPTELPLICLCVSLAFSAGEAVTGTVAETLPVHHQETEVSTPHTPFPTHSLTHSHAHTLHDCRFEELAAEDPVSALSYLQVRDCVCVCVCVCVCYDGLPPYRQT